MAQRLIGRLFDATNRNICKVYWNAELAEYRVMLVGAPDADYFTNDKADAFATAEMMAKQYLHDY